MLKHFLFFNFRAIMIIEIETFKNKNIWKKILQTNVMQSISIAISIMWIFKYKFDEKKYLMKFKIKLIARSDLQRINQNTYAITLIARIFRFLMILMIAFNLQTKQYDVINAFANNSINESINCKSFQNWLKFEILLLLRKALYELKQSSIL